MDDCPFTVAAVAILSQPFDHCAHANTGSSTWKYDQMKNNPVLESRPKRRAGREKNHALLIEATLEAIAEEGFADTSVSAIIARAGLSRGMIHLHFNGKDGLLEAAARQFSKQYFTSLEGVFSQADVPAHDRIAAVICSDLSEAVLNERSVRIWYAFRGESRDRAGIRRFSDTRDDKLRSFVLAAFQELTPSIEIANPNTLARDATHGTLAMLEGMWTDYFLHPDVFHRATAKRIVFRFLRAMFPLHFSQAGPK